MEKSKAEIQTALLNNDQDDAAKKAQEHLDRINNVPLTIAIIGESGSGKSTLVNALRGIRNKSEGAAPTGVKETTIEPTEYTHPQNPNIKIWDLPGIGTTRFRAKKYLKHVGFKKYDFFIIVSSDSFSENDAKLAKEIKKMKKKFYFARAKIDHNIRDEKECDPELKEEDLLKTTRDNCIKELEKLKIESPKVFLVSGFRLHLYEFKELWKALGEEFPEQQRDVLLLALPVLSEEVIEQKKKGTILGDKIKGIIKAEKYEEEIQTALENNDQAEAAKNASEYLEWIKNVPLTIAITGESGSGKSTLVNALRGIENKTEGAAPTGVKETTMEPTEYTHPQNPNVKIWDLPGVGTTRFRAKKYLKHVGFKKYDFFIIVSCDRFRENDAKLAQEIKRMKKKFYFVRSKIDHNIRDEKASDPELKEEDLLKTIRDNCIKELEQLEIESPKVFLVSGLKIHLYEFKKLWKALEEELPQQQRDALLLALPIFSEEVLEQKKKNLGDIIKWYTLASVGGAAVPVPGISESLDLGMIVGFVIQCRSALGLSPDSLQMLSTVSDVQINDLKAEVKSLLALNHVTKDLVIKVLSKSAALIFSVAIEEGTKFIPIIGTIIAMSISGVTTYKTLHYLLDSLSEDALQVFRKAQKGNKSE